MKRANEEEIEKTPSPVTGPPQSAQAVTPLQVTENGKRKFSPEIEGQFAKILNGQGEAPNEYVAYMVDEIRSIREEIKSLNERIAQAKQFVFQTEQQLYQRMGAHDKTVEDCLVWITKEKVKEVPTTGPEN